MKVTDELFAELVQEAWEKIPHHFDQQMENVSVVIRNESARELKISTTLLGLFEGVPKTAWGQVTHGVQPSIISLFQKNICRDCHTIRELKNRIQEVLMHEIGHYFGFNEKAMYTLDRRLRNKLLTITTMEMEANDPSLSDIKKGEDQIKPGTGALLSHGIKKIAVYKDTDGTVHRFSPVCTHLGCLITWNDSEKTWDCPCHGSRFSAQGEVINGPAKKNLEKL